MPYRSGFEFRNGGLGPYIEAIPLAAVGSACLGVALLVIWLLLTEMSWSVVPSSPGEFASVLVGLITGIGFAVTAAAFVVGFYLVIFGLPVAILLGPRLHRPWALTVTLLDAGASTLFVMTSDSIEVLQPDGPPILLFLWALSFALPAGYLYRRGVIALREQAEAFNDS